MTRHSLLFIFIASIILLLSFSANPPQGRTGGPGESTCASVGCHVGVNIAFDGRIELRGLPEEPETDVSYNLIVDLIVDSGTPARGGFQMMALSDDEVDLGGFSNPGDQSTISFSGNRTYFEHDPAKNFEDSDTLSYTVDFKIDPQFEDQQVIFYAAANLANGSGSSGDRIITLSDTISLKSSADTILTAEFVITPPGCPDGNDGSVKIIPSGGFAPYSFFIEDRTIVHDSCAVFNQLSSGDFLFTIRDANDQEFSQLVNLPTVESDITPPIISCIADTLTITSCTPFSYPIPSATDHCGSTDIELISGKGPNQSFESGIHLEIYEATDQTGNTARCTIVIYNQVILNTELSVNDLKCIGDSLGSVTYNITGSNPPFSVQHSEDLNLDSLPLGEHVLQIIDASGCTNETVITIEDADSLFLEIIDIKQPISASSGDGSIDIEVEGGQKPYTFTWRTEDEIFSNSEDLTLLFPGEYYVEVMDANSCLITSDTIRLDAITNLTDVSVSTSISLYPNPSSTYISVTSTAQTEIQELQFYDVTGQRLMTVQREFETIPVSHLPEGVIYIVITMNNNKKGLSRFLKTL